MKSNRGLVIFITLILTLSIIVTGCGSKAENTINGEANSSKSEDTKKDKKIKVALILPGTANDGGWNTGGYQGLEDLKKKRDDVEVTYIESISATDAEAALRDYSEKGYDLILGFDFAYGDAILKVANDYPDQSFGWVQGYKQAKNVSTFIAPLNESAYLAGVVGGYMSKTGKLGFIGGMDTPPMISALEGYKEGAKSVNPKIQVIHSFAGSWSDVEKARQTALSQIETGVDYIMGRGDGLALGVLGAAKEKGIYAVGDMTDQNELAPENIITSTVWDLSVAFNQMVDDVKNNKFGNENYSIGIKEGAIDIAPFHGLVPEETEKKIIEIKEKLKNGEIVLEEKKEISK